MINELLQWHNTTRIQRAIKALQANSFVAESMDNGREQLFQRLESLIPTNASVGLGGSMTVKQLGLAKWLVERGNTVFDHSRPGLNGEESIQIRRQQLTADFFICSSNAITLDGKLVNIDGAGNRVAAMTFGPRNVIVIAGDNKLTNDIEDGLARIRTIAAPINAKRLKKATPCATTGVCHDCKSPERICTTTHILTKKPSTVQFYVMIIPEQLGF